MEVTQLRASRRAHRAHITHVFGKIAEILDSEEAPNERNMAILQAALDQIELKKATLLNLDTRILETIEEEEALEAEILETEDVTFTVAEKIAIINSVLARPKPLNVQAVPFQPASQQPLNEDNSFASNATDEPLQDQPETGVQLPQVQGYVNTFSNISQNVSRLPKLTLPIFGGD